MMDIAPPSRSLDEIMDLIPVGRYHYMLLILAGLAFASDAMEVNILYFTSHCAAVEWNLTSAEEASIISVVFGGQLIGNLFWGIISDMKGRRKTFLAAFWIIAIAGFLSGLSPTYGVLLVLRFIVGFGIGGSPIPFDLLAELLPRAMRGKYLVYIEFWWTFGTIFVTGLAWLILSSSGWRTLIYVTAAPVTLSCIISYFYLPESPRWLLTKGRVKEAETVLKNIATVNNVKLPPFKLSINGGSRGNQIDSYITESVGCIETIRTECGSILEMVGNKKIQKIVCPLMVVWMVFGFTYNGLIFFSGRLYTSDDDNNSCSFDYFSIFINATGEICGVILAIYLIDYQGRSRSQYMLYTASAIAVVFIGISQSKNSLLVIAIIARVFIMAASCATWVATPELLVTEIRSTGHAVCNALARVAAFTAPYMILSNLNNTKCGIILATFNLIGAIAAFMLPETGDQYLDSVYQIDHRSSFSINNSRIQKSDEAITSPILPIDRRS